MIEGPGLRSGRTVSQHGRGKHRFPRSALTIVRAKRTWENRSIIDCLTSFGPRDDNRSADFSIHRDDDDCSAGRLPWGTLDALEAPGIARLRAPVAEGSVNLWGEERGSSYSLYPLELRDGRDSSKMHRPAGEAP